MLGAGERLFDRIGDRKRVRLVAVRVLGESLALLTYEVVRKAEEEEWSGPASIR